MKKLFTLLLIVPLLTAALPAAAQEVETVGYANIWITVKAVPSDGGQVRASVLSSGLPAWKDVVEFQQTVEVGTIMGVNVILYNVYARTKNDYTFGGWYEDTDGDGQLDITIDQQLSEQEQFMVIAAVDDDIAIYATKLEASAGIKPATSQSTLFAYFTHGAKVAVSYHQGEDRGNCGSVFIDKTINAPGDQVTVRALPNDGFQFEYWQDASDMGNIVSRDNPYTFTVEGGERLYAYFTAIDAPVVNLPEEGGFSVTTFDGPWVMTDDARRAGAMVLVMEAEDLVRTADGKTFLDMTKEESHFDIAQANKMPTIIYGKGAVRFAYKLDYGYARKSSREALVQWSTARGTNVKGENLYVYAFRPDLGAFVTIGNSDLMLNPEVSTTISVPSNTAYFKMDAFDLVDDQGNIPTVIGLSPETFDKAMSGIEDTPTANVKSIVPAIYDLQGRRVQGKPNKGLYIIDGKKHSVK